MSATELRSKLALEDASLLSSCSKTNWAVFPTSAVTGDGLEDAIAWLAKAIRNDHAMAAAKHPQHS
jgi:hypothetical protein